MAVVDGVDDPWRRGGRPPGLGVRTVKGGDGSVPCVSAASIIAKVHRDRLMHTLQTPAVRLGGEQGLRVQGAPRGHYKTRLVAAAGLP